MLDGALFVARMVSCRLPELCVQQIYFTSDPVQLPTSEKTSPVAPQARATDELMSTLPANIATAHYVRQQHPDESRTPNGSMPVGGVLRQSSSGP